MVGATEFPELSDQFGVSGVPHTIINSGEELVVGAVPEAMFVEKLKEMLGE